MKMTKGTYYRITYRVPPMQTPTVTYGTFVVTGISAKEHIFMKYGDKGGCFSVPVERFVSAKEVTPAAKMEMFPLYEKCMVRYFGSEYQGTIVGRKRTRVCVAFRTNGGKDYEKWVPVAHIEPVKKPIKIAS